MMFTCRPLVAATLAATVALLSGSTTAQTYTSCNPLASICPPDPALGKTIDIDFTRGASDLFTAGGGDPTYDSNGVSFTVAQSGNSPQLISLFYIMFGRVEITMKAAPGAGIVSSLVFQSDCLDEIDNEWLGADSEQLQTNYFVRGATGSYDRGQFNPAPNNQDEFITYTVDWTSDRIVWTVGETVIRTLDANAAGTDQYPQTPMQIKFGAWSGGDPSNSQGTIDWAHGPTDYSAGPYSMVVQRVKVTDYSTGSKYTYGDASGSWRSIRAEGGSINGNMGGAGDLSTTAITTAASATTTANVPAGGIGSGTRSGSSDLPPGWVMTSDGKIVPSSSATGPQEALSSRFSSVPYSVSVGASGPESFLTITATDSQGAPVTRTVAAGAVPTKTDSAVQSKPEAPDNGAPGLGVHSLSIAISAAVLASALCFF